MRSLFLLATVLTLAGRFDGPKELGVSSLAESGAKVVALRAPSSSTVLIPEGSFTMGSTEAEVQRTLEECGREPVRGLPAIPPCLERTIALEREAHVVRLSAFRIDRREVKVADYRRCVEAGRCALPPYAQGGERFDRPDFPVSLVTWDEASSYCEFVGGRLPTEAEWERAARGPRGRRYPWGHLFHARRANGGASLGDRHDDTDGHLELAPTGSYPQGRTPEGIEDLAGNVAEWVADSFDESGDAVYRPEPVMNPLRKGGFFRVVRGGGYRSPRFMLRSSARHFVPSPTRSPDIGFRCAYDA